VGLLAAPGRTRMFRAGVQMEIPADIPIPTCAKCGETYLGPEDSARIDQGLRGSFDELQRRRWGEFVERFQSRHHVSQREIARVLGITPSHLSHVLSAQSEPSVPLTRLAEALVAFPAEFVRHLKRNEALAGALGPRVHYKWIGSSDRPEVNWSLSISNSPPDDAEIEEISQAVA
jgi:transcriptional regulator with XRE-family HTH domain